MPLFCSPWQGHYRAPRWHLLLWRHIFNEVELWGVINKEIGARVELCLHMLRCRSFHTLLRQCYRPTWTFLLDFSCYLGIRSPADDDDTIFVHFLVIFLWAFKWPLVQYWTSIQKSWFVLFKPEVIKAKITREAKLNLVVLQANQHSFQTDILFARKAATQAHDCETLPLEDVVCTQWTMNNTATTPLSSQIWSNYLCYGYIQIIYGDVCGSCLLN